MSHHLFASFCSNQQIQTGVIVQKWSIQVKIFNFSLCVIFKFDRLHWKKIRYLSYVTSKLFFFVPCDLEIWRMNLKNIRAPLVSYFKLCASFNNHQWIVYSYSPEIPDSGQNLRFFVLCDLEIWWMTFKNNRAPNFVHHFISISEFKLELWSGPLWPWPLTLTFCMNITFVNGNNFWKFDDAIIRGTLGVINRRTNRHTDGRTDWSALRATWLQLKTSVKQNCSLNNRHGAHFQFSTVYRLSQNSPEQTQVSCISIWANMQALHYSEPSEY